MNPQNKIIDFIGNTPTVRLLALEKKYGISSSLFAKLEFMNPFGSSKDRAANFILLDAVRMGRVSPGGSVIEATSGNMGISLAAIGKYMGLRVKIVMPEDSSKERRQIISALGAEIILTKGGMCEARAVAEETSRLSGEFYLDQFNNCQNVFSHRLTTAPELYASLPDVDIFICGVGTGGTIMGVGGYLKEKNSLVKIVAVEPAESAALSHFLANGGAKIKQIGNFTPSSHGISGIGAGFLPPLIRNDMIDDVITVRTDEAYFYAKELAMEDGIMAGISSGAVLSAMLTLGKAKKNKGKKIAAILPDRAERYLSLDIYERKNC